MARRRNFIRLIALALLLAGAGFVAGSWWFLERRLAADRGLVTLPADFPYAVEPATFAASDGVTLQGWFLPAPDSTRAIILLHGYRGHRRSMLSRAHFLRAAGYSVLLYDARACGESGGELISLGYFEARDLLAAARWLQQRGVREIAYLGISQGGATVLLAAERLPRPAAVILESTYDTLENALDRRFRQRLGLPGWLAGAALFPLAQARLGIRPAEVRPIDHLAALRCPLLIISGTDDPYTLAADSERLFAAANEPKSLWLVPDAGHENLHRAAGGAYEQRVLAFLAEHFPPQH